MQLLKRYLCLSQITLFMGLLICTAIMPHVAITNGGVSNFGNHLTTAPFYIAAFLLNGLFLYLAAREVQSVRPQPQYMSRSLTALGIGTFIILLSTFPRRFSHVYSDIHDGLGILLYGYYFLVSIWIVRKQPTPVTLCLLLGEAFGSLIGLLSVLKIVHLLFIGQIIGALGFGLLLYLALPAAVEKRS